MSKLRHGRSAKGRWLSISEAAQYAGLQNKTIAHYLESGLPHARIGQTVRILTLDLDTFRAARRATADDLTVSKEEVFDDVLSILRDPPPPTAGLRRAMARKR